MKKTVSFFSIGIFFFQNVCNAFASQISYTFNSMNMPTSMTDSNNVTINFVYSADGLTLQKKEYPNGKSVVYQRDEFNRVLFFNDVNGSKTTYIYDSKNRVQQVLNDKVNDQEDNVYYETNVDENGLFGGLEERKLSNSGKTISSTKSVYDPFLRLGQQTISNGADKTFEVRNNNYNDNSSLTSTVFSSTADATDNSNYRLIYAYDASGLLTQYQKFPNSSPSQASYSEQYQFDGNSNVIARTTIIGGTSKNISYTYDTSNRLTNYNDGSNHTPFAYDADGRMTTDDQGNTYIYDDFFNKITSVSNLIAKPVANYTYYPDGLRQTKTIAQSTGQPLPISFYYSASGNLVNEVQSDGASSSYLMSPSGTQARYVKDSSGKDIVPALYYIKDNKKVNKTLGANAQIVPLNYSPYGEKMGDTDQTPAALQDNPFGYEDTAMTDKETKLILLGARYYNPRLMRFMSMDSYPLENRYSYTSGDPINFSDPSGHMSGLDVANVIVNVVTAVASVALAIPSGGASTAAEGAAVAGEAAGAAAASSETTAVGGAAAANATSQTVKSVALNIAKGAVVGAGLQTGTNALAGTFGDNMSAGEWGSSIAFSAALGAVTDGVVGGAKAARTAWKTARAAEQRAGVLSHEDLLNLQSQQTLLKRRPRMFIDKILTIQAIAGP
jgi:RHS repeat-associated protein